MDNEYFSKNFAVSCAELSRIFSAYPPRLLIRICKDRNVLREYLLGREKWVVTIMMSLLDDEQIMKSFIRSERHEAAQDKVKEKAVLMLRKGKISIDEIQTFFPELSDDEIEENDE